MANANINRITTLDLLRFFAAVSVVVYHYIGTKNFDGPSYLSAVADFGYLGVPLFFMISGYVIFLSASNRTYKEFIISRFFRLYPTFWVSVCLSVFALFYFIGKRFSVGHVAINLTMFNDYLHISNIDGVYWTLHAEVQFYGCIFLLLLTGVFYRYRLWLTIWIIMTLSFIAFQQPFFMGWFISPWYSSLFISGIAFYLIQHENERQFGYFVLGLSYLLSIYCAVHAVKGFVPNPGVDEKTIACSIITFFYIIFFLLAKGRIALAGNKIYLILGGLTYPLYLIHNSVGKSIIKHYYPGSWGIVPVLLVFCLMVFISFLIYHFIEKRLVNPWKRQVLGWVSTERLTSEIS